MKNIFNIRDWSRTEVLTVIGLIVAIVACIAAIVVVPEVRRFLGIDDSLKVGDTEIVSVEQNKKIFDENNPLPIGFNKVPLGTRLSVLKLAYSNLGTIGPSSYEIRPSNGLFALIVFWYESKEIDPVVNRVAFYFKDNAAKELIRDQALQTFGVSSVKSKIMGTVLTWENVNNHQIEITDSWLSVDMVKVPENKK